MVIRIDCSSKDFNNCIIASCFGAIVVDRFVILGWTL